MRKYEIIKIIKDIKKIFSDLTNKIDLDGTPEVISNDIKRIDELLKQINLDEKSRRSPFKKHDHRLYNNNQTYRQACLEELVIRNFTFGLKYDEIQLIVLNTFGEDIPKGTIKQIIQNYLLDEDRYEFVLDYLNEAEAKSGGQEG